MRCVLQRVKCAHVDVDGERIAQIGPGLMVLVGAEAGDTRKDMCYCAEKIAGMRIFEDDEGKMNRAVAEVGGQVLLVSQFTLLADARHGRRPSLIAAARPEEAQPLFESMAAFLSEKGISVSTGRFQAHMQVGLVNDGPVTILIDSKKIF